MTSESKTWNSLKNEYLRQVEKALASSRHPRRKEVLEDVRSHLDRRFAELKPEGQTWENFQAIITAMGPASDYAELLEPESASPKRNVRRKHLMWAGLAGVVVVAAILLTTAIPDEKVGYIIAFEPVEPFKPQTAKELLNAFNEKHPRGIRTHHFRTGIHGDKLQGHICVDTKAAKQAIVNMIDKSKELILVTVKPATQKDLERHYALGQSSLEPKLASKGPASLGERWRYIDLLDDNTRMALVTFEKYYLQQYHVETGYKSASESEKAAMVEQWKQEIQSSDYDKAVRAATALSELKSPVVATILAKVAIAPKGSNRVKWVAVRGLAKTAVRETVPALITLLDHNNANIRTYTKVALAEISGEFFGDSKEKWSNWARKQGIEVKQMDVGQRQTTSTQSRTYPTRPPRSRYETVSRTGNWPAGNCSVGGTVYREAGYGSVEHARVCLSSEQFGSWVVATDYGRFDFDHIPAGVYTLRTTDTFGYKETSYNPENKPGEAPSFRLKDGEERWQVRLKVEPVRPYLHVSGRILDAAGKPITNNQDLRVDAWLKLPQGHLKGCYRPVASSGVDEQDGSYLLKELDGRPVYVMVRDLNAYQKDNPYPPCYYPGTFSRGDAKMITFDNHESLENADIQLARKGGVALQGVVTDESTGEPVPNAMVVIRHADMLYDLFPGYTDQKGYYRIEGLGDGSFLAYADAMYKGFVKTRKLFTIEPGAKEAQLDITLRRGARISGTFVDADGSPWQLERAHGSTSIPGSPHVGNASNFPYRNKYGPSVVWGTTVFYNQGEGDQPSSMMVYPTRHTFLIEAMMPGETHIQFSPRDPRGRVLKILYNGKDIKNELISTEPGQEVKDVTIVVGTSGGIREQRTRTSDRLQFALYDAFGREVHSQDYKGVPIFLEFGACW